MFKYELNQLIWYMRDDRVHSAQVLARKWVDNWRDKWTSTDEQRKLFTPFGPGIVMYGTCHGLVAEVNAYGSREALVEHLLKTSGAKDAAQG